MRKAHARYIILFAKMKGITDMSNIKIGWSEVSIVPEGRRVDLVGQFYERISGEVETPIAVSALAMECGDDHFVFVPKT